MSQFKEGDKLAEINSDGVRQSDSTWTFRRYAKNGRVMLMEFKDDENCNNGFNTFPPEYFRLLTPLEELL